MKNQPEFMASYIGPWWAGRLGGTLEQALRNFLKFQQCSPVQSLQLPSWLFTTMTLYTKATLHTATTLPPVTIICFEVWNLTMIVSAIHDDEWLEPFSLMLEMGYI